MKTKCPKCGPVDTILKMGGLICDKCRVILFWPSSTEWLKEFNNQKPKKEKLKS